MARGRKRKAGKRHPSGKLVQPRRGESQSDIMETALDARQRHYGIGAKQARDERLGTALGRLSFAGKITPDQYAAGELYGELMARHNAVMGLPIDQPRSVTGLLINEGIFGGGAPDPDPELVDKIRRQAAGADSEASRAVFRIEAARDSDLIARGIPRIVRAAFRFDGAQFEVRAA